MLEDTSEAWSLFIQNARRAYNSQLMWTSPKQKRPYCLLQVSDEGIKVSQRSGGSPSDIGRRRSPLFYSRAGLRYNVFGFNFSYLIPSGQGISQNPLASTLRFGLTFDLLGEQD